MPLSQVAEAVLEFIGACLRKRRSLKPGFKTYFPTSLINYLKNCLSSTETILLL